jgi:hypothetical protein
VSRLYVLVGWGIVALGGLHMFTTFRLATTTPVGRVWFFGSGIAMSLAGALNLLHRTYGKGAPGLRLVCRMANVGLLVFAVVAGRVTHASPAEYLLIVGLLGTALILSFVSSASLPLPK